MTLHASVDQLSSYLDAELAGRERDALEGHLGDCPSCRRRLDGLRAVVARLEGLERQAPPADLAFQMERRLALEAGRVGLRGRVEETLKTLLPPQALMPVFGLIVALALIVYLFSFAVARNQAPGTRLVLPPAESSPAAARSLEGRHFTRVDGVWIERGLADSAPEERLDLRGGAPPPPDLAAFRELGHVRLVHRGRVVEVVFPP